MSHVDPLQVQILAALLFAIGLGVVAARRNLFFQLMGIELMLNAVNLSLIAFSHEFTGSSSLLGQLAPVLVIAVAAAGACVGLAMVIYVVRDRAPDSDAFTELKE
jgi:NADH:ubiquinone oxidoreductase subunit K